MANTTNSTKQEAYKLVFWQFIVISGLAVILWLLQGMQSGASAFLGGLAYVLPNLMFVQQVFDRTGAQQARQFLIKFVIGEVTKLIASAVLFVLIVKYLPVKLLSVLGGYIVAIFAFWVVSFVFLSHEHPGEGK